MAAFESVEEVHQAFTSAMEHAMISLEDCIAMCGLSAEQVAAIAEHERIPEIIAAAMADALLHQVGGVERIAEMMLDDINIARSGGHADQASKLDGALAHFLREHPVGVDAPRQEATPPRPAWAA
jgi:hypothetical protein